MKRISILAAVICVALTAGTLLGQETESTASLMDKLSGGGDIRIREVYFDNIPIVADPPGITRGGDNHFFRFRTRLWGEVAPMDNIKVRGRLVNEFRHFEQPENSSWNALDEIVVDQLYLDVTDLFDGAIDLRLGRQDLIYGTGKVILEGTPKDGSRTIYFDAVKLSLKSIEGMKVDFLGMYNQPENELVIHGEDRDLTGLTPRFDDITESGAGFYAKNSMIEQLPFELYYLYKNESDWDTMSGTNAVHVEELDLNTVGFRMMPKWNDMVDASLEAAIQDGERGEQDVEGFMVDAVANLRMKCAFKTVLSAGYYHLSGDDPATPEDEGWNPLWGRWPQNSELYIYAFDANGAGRWSNLSMPHVDISMNFGENAKTKFMVAHLSAPEENGPSGPLGGDERGWLFTSRTDITLGKGLLTSKDKLFGHLLLEVLEPGDYYGLSVDETAYFARWELSYAF